MGLVGPNGAGKTTLLHLAVGLLSPTAGSIEVLGGHPASDAAQLAKVGFVAQDAPNYAGLSIADHLRFGAHTTRLRRSLVMSGLSKAMLPVMAPLPWVHALLVAVIDVVVRRSRCDVPAEGIECHRAELRVLVQGADVLTSPAHRA